MQTSLDLERGYVSRLGVLVLLTIMIAPTLLIGQSKAKHPTEAKWDCIQGKDFVRDRRGRAVWLSSHELESRVRKKTKLQAPGTLGRNKMHGTVTLQVLIARDGTVECARAIKGDALATWSALNAIQSWVFAPYEVEHVPHPVLGEISLKYDFSY